MPLPLFPQRPRKPSFAAVLVLPAMVWSAMAFAAPAAPPRPVASEAVVVQPGEPEEVRAKRGAKRRSGPIKSKRDDTKDNSRP